MTGATATQLYGWNMHVWDVSYKQLVQGRQISIAGQTIFVFASGLSKLSILVSYLRISVKGTWFHRLTWASIGLVGAAIPAFLLLLWLQCKYVTRIPRSWRRDAATMADVDRCAKHNNANEFPAQHHHTGISRQSPATVSPKHRR